jgi:hypothetical protein
VKTVLLPSEIIAFSSDCDFRAVPHGTLTGTVGLAGVVIGDAKVFAARWANFQSRATSGGQAISRITARQTVQLRFEFLNIWNHPPFAPPGGIRHQSASFAGWFVNLRSNHQSAGGEPAT